MSRLVTVVVMSALAGCSSVGVQSKARTASDVQSSEAELTALKAELESQAEELRTVRGQLALARAEVHALRGDAAETAERRKRGATSSKQGGQPPWLRTPVMIQTESGEREVLEYFEDERLPTTKHVPKLSDVPDLPEFIEEETLSAPTLAAATLVDSGVEDYRRGLRLVQEQRFDDALRALTAFLDVHPNHPYADNALFWRGEIHYLRHEYGPALEDFRRIEKHHPWGNKVPDALYRIGQIHLKRGDTARAQAYFDKVREQFPDTAAARLALREDAS